ncbi:hypothetical protein BJ742DRAFT_738778 [Cladochytrium replicatum]|nr:hypothetical protein BJ742DRAFT_738778 [Cladochytrium replicatum]
MLALFVLLCFLEGLPHHLSPLASPNYISGTSLDFLSTSRQSTPGNPLPATVYSAMMAFHQWLRDVHPKWLSLRHASRNRERFRAQLRPEKGRLYFGLAEQCMCLSGFKHLPIRSHVRPLWNSLIAASNVDKSKNTWKSWTRTCDSKNYNGVAKDFGMETKLN